MITAETLIRFRLLMSLEGKLAEKEAKELETLKERLKFEEPELYKREYKNFCSKHNP